MELVFTLAHRNIHGALPLPKTEKAAQSLQSRLNERLATLAAKADELARSRTGDEKLAPLFVQVGKPEDACFGHVAPKRGWLVEVWPGEGCESALFGLCQYPRRILSRTGEVSTGYEDGWLLKGFCKTQYAGEHGWEHFLKCHRQIISLLDFWRQVGVMVEVTDEGEFAQLQKEVRKGLF